jgi:hypothetical protein
MQYLFFNKPMTTQLNLQMVLILSLFNYNHNAIFWSRMVTIPD